MAKNNPYLTTTIIKYYHTDIFVDKIGIGFFFVLEAFVVTPTRRVVGATGPVPVASLACRIPLNGIAEACMPSNQSSTKEESGFPGGRGRNTGA